MPRFFQGSFLVAVLGGVGCTLVGNLPACAQNTATVRRDRTDVAASTSVSARSGASALSHADTFSSFIQEIGFDDLAARKETITGERQSRVDWKTVNHTRIGLSDDEWVTAYSILLDGSQRVADLGDQMHEALGWKDGRFEADPSRHATERLAKVESLSQQGEPIVGDTVAKLRQVLGDDAFNKLASFVYNREGGQTIVNQGPIHRGPIQTAKASGIQAQK
jgi:hypothetical protein